MKTDFYIFVSLDHTFKIPAGGLGVEERCVDVLGPSCIATKNNGNCGNPMIAHYCAITCRVGCGANLPPPGPVETTK